MKNRIITIVFFLSLLVIGFPKLVFADEYFNHYESNISWNKQMAFLGDFAVFLEKNPETIGYIGFYVGEKESLKKIQSRIDKSVKFLTKNMKIEKSRIVVIKGDTKKEMSEIILQPVDKNSPPPRFY
jgi:nucleosome binding factor SPN SPT16 subunit